MVRHVDTVLPSYERCSEIVVTVRSLHSFLSSIEPIEMTIDTAGPPSCNGRRAVARFWTRLGTLGAKGGPNTICYGRDEADVLAGALRRPRGSLYSETLESSRTEPGTSSVSLSFRMPMLHFDGRLAAAWGRSDVELRLLGSPKRRLFSLPSICRHSILRLCFSSCGRVAGVCSPTLLRPSDAEAMLDDMPSLSLLACKNNSVGRA